MLGFVKIDKLRSLFGKTIKKVMLIDFLLLFLLIALSLFFIFKISRKREIVFVDLTFERQRTETNFIPPEYWQAGKIKNGSVIYNSLGNEIAEVIYVEHRLWRGGQRYFTYITVRLDALYHSANQTYTYDGKPLVIGEKLSFTIGNVSYSGLIQDLYLSMDDKEESYIKKDAKVVLFCREYEAWHAEEIRELKVKSLQGELVAEVIKSKIRPAEIAVETDSGQILRSFHPFKKDIDLEVMLYEVDCVDEGICFYNQTNTFMVGSEFWLDSGRTYLGKNCSVKDFEIINQK